MKAIIPSTTTPTTASLSTSWPGYNDGNAWLPSRYWLGRCYQGVYIAQYFRAEVRNFLGNGSRRDRDRSEKVSFHSTRKTIFALMLITVARIPPGGGGGGVLNKVLYGLRPEVQPRTLSYTILAEKVPLLYTFY